MDFGEVPGVSCMWACVLLGFAAVAVGSVPAAVYSNGYSTPYLQMPLDSEGFVQSFLLNETNLWRPFFETYGIVVIRDLFTAQECDETVGEMWSSLRHLGFREDDPSTWDRMPWGAHLGFLGNHAVLSPKACANRQQENLYHFHRLLYETDHLVVSVDRLGWIRPTRGVNGTPDHTEWRSVKNWLHWDMNPYTGSTSTYAYQGNYPENPHNKGFGKLKTQGILALVDTRTEDGGFHAVPGFHKHIQAWGVAHPEIREWYTYPTAYDETTMQVPYEDGVRLHVQPMPIRKGSYLCWHSAIPHGTRPNDSPNPRIVQYLKMAPVADKAIAPAAKNSSAPHNCVQHFGAHHMPTQSRGFTLTNLGERLYGFTDWAADDTAHSVLALDSNKTVIVL